MRRGDNFGDFIFAPYCDYIRKYGCNKDNLDFSLFAQEKFTAYASAEDSIRYFLNKFEDETFEKMIEWSSSKNYFLRRLSSEGTRAKLPWCQKINLDYKKTIQILDNLYFDKSRFVTRSVANHLNDISKIDSDLVIDVLEKWRISVETRQCLVSTDIDLDYIISHGTRTLVKVGNKRTLEFLGYSSNPQIELKNFIITNREVKIGEKLEFDFDIFLEKSESLIIDYKVYFVGKNGKLLPRVFKLKKIGGTQGLLLQISKTHKLKLMSTKALYTGTHFVEIIINGNSFGKKEFELII
ncbi:MAG: DNA alkylation repair protein [Candidatus Gracilibacteria bacterium]|nr:DNA alkylation repair protein [Candidatus Gracilibacteria bacterium]